MVKKEKKCISHCLNLTLTLLLCFFCVILMTRHLGGKLQCRLSQKKYIIIMMVNYFLFIFTESFNAIFYFIKKKNVHKKHII